MEDLTSTSRTSALSAIQATSEMPSVSALQDQLPIALPIQPWLPLTHNQFVLSALRDMS